MTLKRNIAIAVFVLLQSTCSGNGTRGAVCVNDDACATPYYICDEKEGQCKHKKAFPAEATEWIGFVMMGAIIGFANAGGIGGGGLLMPIIIIFFGADVADGTPISNFCIVISAIMRFLINFRQMHPERPKLMQNYDITVIFMPLVVVGTAIGVMLNSILPTFVSTILLIIVVTYMLINSLKKFRVLWRKENLQKAKERAARELETKQTEAAVGENLDTLHQNQSNQVQAESAPEKGPADYERLQSNQTVHRSEGQGDEGAEELGAQKNDAELQKIIKREGNHWQWRKTPFMLFSFVLVIVISLLRGNKNVDSQIGVETCGAADWGLFAVFILVSLVLTFFISKLLRKEREEKVRCGYDFHESDIEFTSRNTVKLSVISVLTGMAGAALGIGGGMIMNPLFLELGQMPSIASATGMYIVMYSAGAITLQFIMTNELLWDYSLVCGLSTILGTYLGISLINRLVKKTGRQSLLILVLCLLILVSIIVIPINSGIRLKQQADEGIDIFAFRDLCE